MDTNSSARSLMGVMGTSIPRIVFLCVHNAGRSQMAAAFARHFGGDRFEVFSGGSDPAAAVNTGVIAAMAEIGIDLGGRRRSWQAPMS